MKKEILEALKAKFEGVSDAILGRIADKLAKTATTSEQVKAAVDAIKLQELFDSYGDSRATEASQTAVQNYEKKHNLKDGKPIDGGDQNKGGGGTPNEPTPPTPPAGGGTDTPDWAKQIIEQNKALADQNKALTDRLNKMDADRTTANRRQRLNDATSSLPDTLRKAYERTAIETLNDDEFEKLMGEITSEADGIVKDLKTKGAVFGRPSNQAANENKGGELTEAQKAAISKREGRPKEGEQPF